MRKKILAAAAILIVLGYAAYSGYRDGGEHRNAKHATGEAR